MSDIHFGVIGGSGLYEMEGLEIVEERRVETPFGDPSDPYVIGRIGDVTVAFLARHGKGHRYLPTEINYRANIFGFKLLGVDTLLSASAVGSMKEEYRPMDIVLPHQFIDRTRHRADTFFGNGIVAHVAFADPICASLSFAAAAAGRKVGATVHEGGTYVCIEGPQFSTRAESHLYRSWGVDVIGMTNLQEAKLAREAEICYATIALVTDYDCWHESEEDVTVEQVIGYLKKNAQTACAMIREVITSGDASTRSCSCRTALASAILTPAESISESRKRELAPLLKKYMSS
jgi:5'-methylthioadenosine phosphorylase